MSLGGSSVNLTRRRGIVQDDHGPAALANLFRHATAPTVSLATVCAAHAGCSAAVPVATINDDSDQRGKATEFVSEMSGDRGEVPADDDSDRDEWPLGVGRCHRHSYSHGAPPQPH